MTSKMSTEEIQNSIENDIAKFNKKTVLYLIHIENDKYKFGITNKIMKTLSSHKRFFNYKNVIKIWDCLDRGVAHNIKTKELKNYIIDNELNYSDNGNSDIIKTNDIKQVVEKINEFVKFRIEQFNTIWTIDEWGDMHLIDKNMEYCNRCNIYKSNALFEKEEPRRGYRKRICSDCK